MKTKWVPGFFPGCRAAGEETPNTSTIEVKETVENERMQCQINL